MPSKKDMPAVRRKKLPGTPVPMPTRTIPRAPGSATPAPMPTREPNYGKKDGWQPRKPAGPKKSSTSRVPKPLVPQKTKVKSSSAVKTIKRILVDPSSFIAKPKNNSSRAPKQAKPKPLTTARVGGVVSIMKKPKKTIY